MTNRFKSFFKSGIALLTGALAFALTSSSAKGLSDALDGGFVPSLGGRQYTGHTTSGGGALAHRRWKKRRASGINPRVRHHG